MIDEARFPGRQGRLLFAYLVAEQGRPVPRDELAEALWGETPPATWDKALAVLVSKLRGLLAGGGLDGSRVLTAAFGCYRLDLPEGSWVDVIAAARAVDEAEEALDSGDVKRAQEAAARADSLVREPFLPGEDGAWVEEKRRELAEIRVRALNVLAEADLRGDEPHEAVRWAKQAIALEPFRETGYRHLMEAHAAAGNPAEALRVYEHCRRLLAEELGTYPSPETESIYRRLLESPTAPIRAAPPFDATPRADDEGQPERVFARLSSRRQVAAFVGAALAASAALVLALVLAHGGSGVPAVVPNSLVKIDPRTNKILDVIRVGRQPVSVAFAGDSAWVVNARDETLTRVDAKTGKTATLGGFRHLGDIAADDARSVWVSTETYQQVIRIDARTLQPDLRDPLGHTTYLLAVGAGSLWVGEPADSHSDPGMLARIDLRTGRLERTFPVGVIPVGVAVGNRAVWVANTGNGTLSEVALKGGAVEPVDVGSGPGSVAVAFGSVWVATDDTIWRVNPATRQPDAVIPVGKSPFVMRADSDAVWVTVPEHGTLVRIDPRTNRVVKRIRLGYRPWGIAVGAGAIWVAVGQGELPQPF